MVGRVSSERFEEAHRITTRLGERPLRAEIEALAQRSRISLDVGVAQQADAFDAHGITAREREVLSLLQRAPRTPRSPRRS